VTEVTRPVATRSELGLVGGALILCLLGGLLVSGCSGGDRDAHVALSAGDAIEYVQTLELTGVLVDGEEQPDIRVAQNVTLRCLREVAEGAWRVGIEYGRARVWVGDLDGAPALDTTDRGYAAVTEVFEDPESDIAVEFAAFWAVSTGTASSCVIDTHAFMAEPTIDPRIAQRMDDNRADDVGSALLEHLLSDPALFFVRLAHGDGPWTARLEFVAALWGPGVKVETQTAVLARDDASITFDLSGKPVLLLAWGDAGRAQRGASEDEDEMLMRAAHLSRLRLEAASFAGNASLAWDDGLPNTLEWSLAIDIRDSADPAWRETAELRCTIERLPPK